VKNLFKDLKGQSSVKRRSILKAGLGVVAVPFFGSNAFAQRAWPNKSIRVIVPVSLAVRVPQVLAVRKNFPAKNLNEFVVYAKANSKCALSRYRYYSVVRSRVDAGSTTSRDGDNRHGCASTLCRNVLLSNLESPSGCDRSRWYAKDFF